MYYNNNIYKIIEIYVYDLSKCCNFLNFSLSIKLKIDFQSSVRFKKRTLRT